MTRNTSRYGTIIIGGGQAGLSTGYYLKQSGQDFVILDASERIGDSWRRRWDSLHLFTPARFDGLPGMPFPAPPFHFPSKNEMGDYLESYAAHFKLPVRSGVRVDSLTKDGDGFALTAGDERFEANQVVVALSSFQNPWVPAFAAELDPAIVQLHSSEYRNPSQLRDGGVLIVGAGNSGSEIGLEVARGHMTWMSGRDVGHVPFRIDGFAARVLLTPLLRVVAHHVLTVDTPMGRRARPWALRHGGPLVRVKPKDIAAAGIERVPRVAGVREGRPALEDGRVIDAANVIWCTGFRPDFSWIDLPVFGDGDKPLQPQHYRGVVTSQPGLYFIGLFFLYAALSGVIFGVGRDAEYIAKAVAAHANGG